MGLYGTLSNSTTQVMALLMQVRLAAIPAPVNMLNLQAGGYWETIRARMVQAERHARGCADFAYCLKHARSMPHFSWRTVALCFKVVPQQYIFSVVY